MQITSREAIIIAYALNCLVVDGHPDLNVSNTELRDIAQNLIAGATK
jgi:hypothetical protein